MDKSIILSKPELLNCKMENYTGAAYPIGRVYRKNKQEMRKSSENKNAIQI